MPPVRSSAPRTPHTARSGCLGGRGGIRTPETGVARLTVFKAYAGSAVSPRIISDIRLVGLVRDSRCDSSRERFRAGATGHDALRGTQKPSACRLSVGQGPSPFVVPVAVAVTDRSLKGAGR